MDLVFICGAWIIFCAVCSTGFFASAIWMLICVLKNHMTKRQKVAGVLSAAVIIGAGSIIIGATGKGPNELLRVQKRVLQLELARPAVVEILNTNEPVNDQELKIINDYLDLYDVAMDTLAENRNSISGAIFRNLITPQYNIKISDIQALQLPVKEIVVLGTAAVDSN